MRFGLLGPANGDLAGLARCAEFLLNSARVTRAIYLGDDDALEETVALWAESLVGPNPSDEGIWERALPVVATGSSDQLDTFVRSERARLRLRSLRCVPRMWIAARQSRCLTTSKHSDRRCVRWQQP